MQNCTYSEPFNTILLLNVETYLFLDVGDLQVVFQFVKEHAEVRSASDLVAA